MKTRTTNHIALVICLWLIAALLFIVNLPICEEYAETEWEWLNLPSWSYLEKYEEK